VQQHEYLSSLMLFLLLFLVYYRELSTAADCATFYLFYSKMEKYCSAVFAFICGKD
jgi:hypothetical protein